MNSVLKPEKQRVFIFDLDNTLGIKKPFHTEIAKGNIELIKGLSEHGNLLCLATDRPKSLALAGMYLAGLNEENINSLFAVRIYEDGLLIESNRGVIYDALSQVNSVYKDLKKIAFGDKAIEFFLKKGFLMYPNSAISNNNGKLMEISYDNKEISEIKMEKNLLPVYRQDNIVRETYKFPDYFFPNLEELARNVLLLSKFISEFFDSEINNWRDVAVLKLWKDSVDVYPIVDSDGISRKAAAMSLVSRHFNITNEAEIYFCCDGENDISLVRFIGENFSNHLIVCPSNVNDELKNFLKLRDLRYVILNEDYHNLHVGLRRVIKNNNL